MGGTLPPACVCKDAAVRTSAPARSLSARLCCQVLRVMDLEALSFLGFGGKGQPPARKSLMAALFCRLACCGLPCPASAVFSPGSAFCLAGSAAFPDTHRSLHGASFWLGMLPPQPSQQPCLSLPNAESLLTAFLAQEKSHSQDIIGTLNEQADVVWKFHSHQACVAGCAHLKHLSFSYKSPVLSSWTTFH